MGKFDVDVSSNYWAGQQNILPKSYDCGFCGKAVTSEKGFILKKASNQNVDVGHAVICPGCKKITMFKNQSRFPGGTIGAKIDHVPEMLNLLYNEARDCFISTNYTAAVLLCRKILMNIAVDLKAKENLSFIKYVEYISDQGYVPPNGKSWVDHIRKKGNEANHEIHLMTEQDAKELIIFVEMLLKFNYEFPNMIPDLPSS